MEGSNFFMVPLQDVGPGPSLEPRDGVYHEWLRTR